MMRSEAGPMAVGVSRSLADGVTSRQLLETKGVGRAEVPTRSSSVTDRSAAKSQRMRVFPSPPSSSSRLLDRKSSIYLQPIAISTEI